ncbi:hypothetical protein SADUNF_Sadunf13G0107800 [Salix dunnii]|uniref:Uncharacterized protein n=1 Tax=Salix dunnii TaxID=1413687 RepID=A0A835JIC4_9ROSI|nr:hypothetical protein SADUNF_Sadunf13G0107800 [Salix dunnii]
MNLHFSTKLFSLLPQNYQVSISSTRNTVFILDYSISQAMQELDSTSNLRTMIPEQGALPQWVLPEFYCCLAPLWDKSWNCSGGSRGTSLCVQNSDWNQMGAWACLLLSTIVFQLSWLS